MTFIDKARAVHGDRYDYSKVEYKNANEKVTIICKVHGEFQQVPYHHLQSQNCMKCSLIRVCKDPAIPAKFILDATRIHAGKYTYGTIDFVNMKRKVMITCPAHGLFDQIPEAHLAGQGCPTCAKERSINSQKVHLAEFIERAEKRYAGAYEYSHVTFETVKDSITIHCKRHGEFKKRCKDFLAGDGCVKCRREVIQAQKEAEKQELTRKKQEELARKQQEELARKQQEELARKQQEELARKQQEELARKQQEELARKQQEELVRKQQEELARKQQEELARKQQEELARKKQEEIARKQQEELARKQQEEIARKKRREWWNSYRYVKLDSVNEWLGMKRSTRPLIRTKKEYLPGTQYYVDGYDPTTKTVYEFHRTYLCGDPRVFSADSVSNTGVLMKDLYRATLKKKAIIKSLGYQYIEIWEYDWIRFRTWLIRKQRSFE
jgi:hypothetical protein